MASPMLRKVGLGLLAVSLHTQLEVHGLYNPGLVVEPPMRQKEKPQQPSGPYGGLPAKIPGTIQAEEFDLGGEGAGYHDTTPGNVRAEFRVDEDVDIHSHPDGYNVGWFRAGEYLRYTVSLISDVEEFDFIFRVASGMSLGSFRVVSGGTGCDDYTTDLTGVVSVPYTGEYNRYVDLEVSGKGRGGLAASTTTILFCIITKAFNLDYFTMTAAVPDGSPYGGTPAIVPGLVQAEEFDLGGEGVAYSDSTAGNTKGAFRPDEDVDINALDDGGFNVGYITAGEYLRYTLDVTKKIENVFFSFRVASGNGLGSFRVVSGGTGCDDYSTDLSGLVEVPSTGGNSRYEDLKVSGHGTGGLSARETKIWLCALSKAFNIDYFTISKTAPVPAVELGGPYRGVAATVPGVVQAEEFDEGGDGVAYKDATSGNKKGDFRPDDDVDINQMDDGGYNVGYVHSGEYMRYTLDVTKKMDPVFFVFRVASIGSTGSFRVVSGGNGCDDYTTDLSGLVNVPSTGGNIRYADLAVSGNGTGPLRPRDTMIWLCVLSKSFNIDYFTMSKTATPPEVPVPAPIVSDPGGKINGPYRGVAATVPGVIQAEEFDEGGEGVAYSDSSHGNNKGAFRPDEDVDINAMDDNNYNVGYITAGEFLRYTINATKKMDPVFFVFRVAASGNTGSFRVVSGGTGCNDYTTDLSGLVNVPSTGGNVRYQDLAVSGKGTGGLSARETQIWLCAVSKSFNIDYFTMSKTTTSSDSAAASIKV